MDGKINVLISEKEIADRVAEMAKELSQEYAGKEVHLVCILKGSVFFTCELAKRMEVPVTMDFLTVSSYGAGTESSGVITLKKDLDEPIEGKDVILVEDIIDTGNTLSWVYKNLKERNPASLKLITLLNKPDRRKIKLDVDMTGFVIPDKFVIGYGLDYDQKYRNLSYVGVIE